MYGIPYIKGVTVGSQKMPIYGIPYLSGIRDIMYSLQYILNCI